MGKLINNSNLLKFLSPSSKICIGTINEKENHCIFHRCHQDHYELPTVLDYATRRDLELPYQEYKNVRGTIAGGFDEPPFPTFPQIMNMLKKGKMPSTVSE